MAVYQAVDAQKLDQDLQSVANAIRAKGKTSQSMAFPDGFVSSVAAIAGGNAQLVRFRVLSSENTITIPTDMEYHNLYLFFFSDNTTEGSVFNSVLLLNKVRNDLHTTRRGADNTVRTENLANGKPIATFSPTGISLVIPSEARCFLEGEYYAFLWNGEEDE